MDRPNWRSPQLASLSVAALAAVLSVQCSSGVAAPSATPPVATPSAAPTARASLPPIGDIPFYKVDAARSGVQPGPGPMVVPVEAWRAQLDCAAGGTTGVVGSGLLVIGCDAPRVTAIDVSSGTVRWTDDLDGPAEGYAVGGDTVYVADGGGGLTAIRLASGDVAWHIRRDNGGAAPVYSPVVDGGLVYLATHDGRFIGVDTATGTIDWTWTAPTGVSHIGGTVVDGTAYVSGDDGNLRAVSINGGNELWSFHAVSGRVSSRSITTDAVFASGLVSDTSPAGELYALDRATGTELWRYQSPSGDQVAPPVNADGVVYAPSAPDGLVALDARDGSLLWRASTAPVGGQAPAIAGAAIYQNTARGVSAYSRTDGGQLWSVDLGASLDNSALVTGGMVIVTDDSGLVRAFVEPRLQAYFPAPSTSPGATAAPSSAPSLPALLSLTATFDQATSGIEVPADVAVGPDGHLYVVNTKTSEVLVLDSDTGAIVRRWGGLGSGQGQFNFNIDPSDEFNAAGGIAVADDGTVYVADTANRRVEVFDAAGNFVSQWGRFGTDDGQFLFPEDIAIGPDGDVYVLDGSRSDIQRFTSDGTFASVVGGYGTGPGQLSSMGGIAVGPDGTIYDADFDPNRVQAWNADGSFAWMMAGDGSISDLFWPADVAVGDNGLLYVSEGPGDPPLRRVTTYDRDRNRIGSWVAPGPTDSLAYRDGSLYVSCFFTSQILKAAPTQ